MIQPRTFKGKTTMRSGYLRSFVVIFLSAIAIFELGETSCAFCQVKSAAETIETGWGLVGLNKHPSGSGVIESAILKIRKWPEANVIPLPTPFPNIVKAWFAADPEQQPLDWKFNADATEISLLLPPRVKAEDGTLTFPHSSLIVMITAEKTVQYADGNIVLSALDSKVNGDRAKLETHPGNHRIGFWSNPADSVTWDYNATRWGMYDVDLVYSTASPDGSEISISVGEKRLDANLKSTGSWYQYTVIPAGRVYLETAGKHPVKVR